MDSPVYALRERLQMSREQFAQHLGLSPHTVALVENGRLRRPRVIWEALRQRGFDAEHLSLRYQLWLRFAQSRSEQVG